MAHRPFRFPRRRQVALANKARLEGLRSRPFVYNAVDQGRFENGESDNEAHRKRITELLDKHSSAPRRLTFKVFLITPAIIHWLIPCCRKERKSC